jgi:hypothetical protein
MPKFSSESFKKLKECHEDLQEIMFEAILYMDFKVTCGHRGKAAQDKAYAEGASTKKYPNSNHNTIPSRSVDIDPWPVDFTNIQRYRDLGFFVMGIAAAQGKDIIWGADWDHDYKINPKPGTLVDWGHFEVVNPWLEEK